MPEKIIKKSGQFGIIVLVPLFILVGIALGFSGYEPASVQAADLEDAILQTQPPVRPPQQEPCDCESGDILNCVNFEYQEDAQACLQYCSDTVGRDVHRLDGNDHNGLACDHLPGNPSAEETEPTPVPTLVVPEPTAAPSDNLIFNGNFEFGFYQVPELGFEPPDVGNVPQNWNWFKSQAYGKYTISNNEGFGIICREDINTGTQGKNSLSLHMQSTDQPDARLGIYQTVNVVPGQDYLFAISGTIQVQPGGSSPDKNHRVQLFFDETGNTDWQAIPNEDWTSLPWPEEELEFDVSGPDDPDIADIHDYYSIVTPESNKMTIFLQGWRRWPNWRTAIFTLDCVALVPLGNVDVGALIPSLSEQSTTEVDKALLEAALVQPGTSAVEAEPAVVSEGEPEAEAEPAETTVIPPSGGILDSKENWLLLALSSIVVITGLIGAGVWNIRRRKG